MKVVNVIYGVFFIVKYIYAKDKVERSIYLVAGAAFLATAS